MLKSLIFKGKSVYLAIIFLLFLCISSFAGTFPDEDKSRQQNSLFDMETADLSFDESPVLNRSLTLETGQNELYAMAGDWKESSGGSEDIMKPGSRMEKWHKYLGYGTVVMAGLTAVTNSNESLHESLAYMTSAGALSTLTTGYLAHRDRFDLDQDLLTKDNLHIALGTLGAVALTTAVAIADDGEESSHSSLGVAGGVLMTLGVIEIKW